MGWVSQGDSHQVCWDGQTCCTNDGRLMEILFSPFLSLKNVNIKKKKNKSLNHWHCRMDPFVPNYCEIKMRGEKREKGITWGGWTALHALLLQMDLVSGLADWTCKQWTVNVTSHKDRHQWWMQENVFPFPYEDCKQNLSEFAPICQTKLSTLPLGLFLFAVEWAIVRDPS